jgi:NADH-quinone oxidoreductase subunit K
VLGLFAAESSSFQPGLITYLADISLAHYLIVAGILFAFGIIGVILRRNAVGMLISVELIMNSINLNFIAFNRYVDTGVDGHLIALFLVLLAACEAAIALAIVINVSNQFGAIEVDRAASMSG